MNHYVTLALTNRKFSVHLHALYSPRTALRMFTPRRDHLMVCLLYIAPHRTYDHWPILTYEPISIFWSNSVEGDLDAILLNSVSLTIQEWQTFKLLRWIQTYTSQRGAMKFCEMIGLQRMNNFRETILWKDTKYEHGGRLKFKIHILFYVGNSWSVALNQLKFGTVEDHAHAYRFYLNNYFDWWNSQI